MKNGIFFAGFLAILFVHTNFAFSGGYDSLIYEGENELILPGCNEECYIKVESVDGDVIGYVVTKLATAAEILIQYVLKQGNR